MTIALKKLGKRFIEGFIGLMTNEKDPHNLMLAFSILKVILVEFDIVGLQEVQVAVCDFNIRNYSMLYSVISPSLSRHERMIFTVSQLKI